MNAELWEGGRGNGSFPVEESSEPASVENREVLKMKHTSFISRTVLDIATFFTVAVLVLVPTVSFAVQLVPNCPAGGCGWVQLVQLGKNLLDFMIFIAVPIAAICFAWAGWLYLSARGDSGQITKAHGIFLNVAVGLVIVLVAWLVVDQILKALVQTGTYIPVLTP